MPEILDLYIQNNFGLFDSMTNSQNAIMDEDGALVLLFMEAWGDTKTKRIIVGSNSITYYQDIMSLGINRDFNTSTCGEEGPMLNLFNFPKGAYKSGVNKDFVACIAPSSNVLLQAYVAYGYKEEEFITWADSIALFSSDVLMNYCFSACSSNAALFAYGVNDTTKDLILSVFDYVSLSPYTITAEDSKNYYPISSCFTDDDGEGGVVSATGNPSPVDATYVPYSLEDDAFGTPVDLGLAAGVTSGGTMELEIAYDKINGNIIILSTFLDADDAPTYDVVWELWVSDDGGATFDSINLETEGLLGGDDNFQDLATYYRGTPRLMAGAEGGFLMGYTRLNSSGYARPYVHQCTYESGGHVGGYSIGEAKECGAAVGPWDADNHMIGPLFFKPPADMLMNIDPVQNLYIGYQIGEGTQIYASFAQASCKSTGLVLEKLDEIAYPLTDSYTYGDESAGTGEIVASITILNTPIGHEDFYSNGYTGQNTDLAVDAFVKEGTAITIEQYEPKDDAYIGGRTAYENPIKHVVKCFIDSSSWNSPNQALNRADYDEFIDRDLRKIYLPPAFFMEYNLNSSKSETVQQTIYLAKFDSFTYEIRQVVPNFVNNEIIYWEANCYNVGNFDVWSRGGGAT